MRILITNDDGIRSPVLPHLARWAMKHGEVTVVAPKTEQSGKSQAIDFRSAVEVLPVELEPGVRAYSMESTPADCVRFAVEGLKESYDLLISGINIGYNLGDDMAYSGTLGAILEGSRCGIRGMAVSADPDHIMEAPAYLDSLFEWMGKERLFETGNLYNINIPPRVEGIRITKQGGMFYTDTFVSCGENLYKQVGAPHQREFTDLRVDIDAVMNHWISVTPITACRTDFSVFEKLVKQS